MPREKQFDTEAALDRAMEAFWAHGYEATSMERLLARMGINRGSFYDTFESKRAVLLEALRRYTADRGEAMRSAAESRRPRGAILSASRAPRCAPPRAPGCRGCLLVNSAVELAPHDAEVAKIVRSGFRDIARFFARLVERGQAAGEIDQGLDAAELGRALLGHLLAGMVLTRSGAPKAMRQTLIDQVERTLG